MPYCTRNSVKTYYEVSGEGYPLVLMHANPFDRRMFLYQVAHFSTYFKVVNIDLRAYGYSTGQTRYANYHERTMRGCRNRVPAGRRGAKRFLPALASAV